MKIWMTLLAVVLTLTLATASQAAKEKPLKGQITAIDGAKVTLTSGGKKNPMTVEVTTDASTVVTRDGKDAKVADLKVGDYVTVSPTTGTAATITASTTKPEKKPKA